MRVDRKTPIIFNFVGLFDTVASFGLIHKNDVSQLNLKMGGKPNKVVHLIASDEYRENFKLTNIDSTIKQDEFLYRIQEQILKYANPKLYLKKDDIMQEIPDVEFELFNSTLDIQLYPKE